MRLVFALSIVHKMSVESTNESHLTPQYTALVELLEKVYAEEIKIKGRIKLLSEQIARDRVICSTGDGMRNEERSLNGNSRRQQVIVWGLPLFLVRKGAFAGSNDGGRWRKDRHVEAGLLVTSAGVTTAPSAARGNASTEG